jgi:hypothetical protein
VPKITLPSPYLDDPRVVSVMAEAAVELRELAATVDPSSPTAHFLRARAEDLLASITTTRRRAVVRLQAAALARLADGRRHPRVVRTAVKTDDWGDVVQLVTLPREQWTTGADLTAVQSWLLRTVADRLERALAGHAPPARRGSHVRVGAPDR